MIINSRLNSDTSSASDVITLSPEPATVSDAEPIKLARRSDANVPCNEVQNEYSLCGTTVIKLAAKKPFSTFRQVFLMLLCPDS